MIEIMRSYRGAFLWQGIRKMKLTHKGHTPEKTLSLTYTQFIRILYLISINIRLTIRYHINTIFMFLLAALNHILVVAIATKLWMFWDQFSCSPLYCFTYE